MTDDDVFEVVETNLYDAFLNVGSEVNFGASVKKHATYSLAAVYYAEEPYIGMTIIRGAMCPV